MEDIRGVSFWKGLGTNHLPSFMKTMMKTMKACLWLQVGFNMFSTAVKQMAFYPTQELIKHVCIAKGGEDDDDEEEEEEDAYHQSIGAGMTEERGQFFSSVFAGMVLGLLAAPINVIKVPLQVRSAFDACVEPRANLRRDALQSGVRADMTARSVCRDVYREYGILGFYRGGLGIVLRDTVPKLSS